MSAIQYLSAAIARPRRTFRQSIARQGGSCSHVARLAVVRLDALLRHLLGIFEFTDSPDCLLRIALTRARADLALPGGTRASRGCPLVELHLWNEHVAASLAGRAHFGQAKCILSEFRHSLELLAQYLAAHPEIGRTALVHARIAISLDGRRAKLESFARSFGFSLTCSPSRGAARVHDYLEDFLIRWLLRAFNPGRSPKRDLPLQRAEFWMTRDSLIARYAAPAPPRPARAAKRLLARAASASFRA